MNQVAAICTERYLKPNGLITLLLVHCGQFHSSWSEGVTGGGARQWWPLTVVGVWFTTGLLVVHGAAVFVAVVLPVTGEGKAGGCDTTGTRCTTAAVKWSCSRCQ